MLITLTISIENYIETSIFYYEKRWYKHYLIAKYTIIVQIDNEHRNRMIFIIKGSSPTRDDRSSLMAVL